MQPSNVTDLLFKELNYRGERQKVIASNIANINTPKYKTKDLSFDNVLNQSMVNSGDLQLKVTNKKHIRSFDQQNAQDKYKIYEVKGLQEQNDGNNVNLDQQMSMMAKNSVMFSAIQSSIKKDMNWMSQVIAESGKN
jgi:flagellar basal-body rod protein FlgB